MYRALQWDAPSPIVHLSWTASEALVILTASGQYRLYQLSTHSSLPPSFTQHAIPNLEELGVRVREAKAWQGGFVALLDDGSFVEVRIPKAASRSGGAETYAPETDALGNKGKRRAVEDDANGGSGGGGNGREHRTIPLAVTGLDGVKPDCWCILPPDPSSTHTLEVLFARGETVYRLDEVDCVDQVRAPSCFG